MKDRFGGRKRTSIFSGMAFTVISFALVLCFFYWALAETTSSVESEQLNSTRQSVRRAAVHCYAVEGQYPPSLGYLEERYGLRVDTSKVIVQYQPVAANLLPEINVFSVKELTDEQGADNSLLDADLAGAGIAQTPDSDDGEPLPPDTDMAGLLLEDAI